MKYCCSHKQDALEYVYRKIEWQMLLSEEDKYLLSKEYCPFCNS